MINKFSRPRGPMDKASAYGAGDCRFESCRGHSCFMTGQCAHKGVALGVGPRTSVLGRWMKLSLLSRRTSSAIKHRRTQLTLSQQIVWPKAMFFEMVASVNQSVFKHLASLVPCLAKAPPLASAKLSGLVWPLAWPASCKLIWLVLGIDPAARSHRVEQFTTL